MYDVQFVDNMHISAHYKFIAINLNMMWRSSHQPDSTVAKIENRNDEVKLTFGIVI